MTLQRSARQIVDYWCEYRTPHPDWPPDLPYALASEVLILLERLRLRDAEAALISEAHDKASPGPATVEPGATSKAPGSLTASNPSKRSLTPDEIVRVGRIRQAAEALLRIEERGEGREWPSDLPPTLARDLAYLCDLIADTSCR